MWMRLHRAAAVAIAVPLIVSGGRLSGPPRATIDLHACDVDATGARGRCGALEVYENRTARTGRRIALSIVVIPATGPRRAADPVFWLEGGPGGAATQAIGPVVQQYLRDLRAERDVVFVDQRGTGGSHPLECDDIGDTPSDLERYFGPLFPSFLIQACRRKLEKIADLRQYTTSIAMDDLDDVRAALGYETIDLAGASYGTQAALVYMRRHGEHVRSAFLVGVAPPDFRLPLPFARAAQHALELTFADCEADRSCHAAFPDARREFDAVLGRFARGPLSVAMQDPSTRQTRTIGLARESYVEHLRLLLYTTFGARLVPTIVHQAFLGNFVPFGAVVTRNGGAPLARGMYFSITCAEDVPFITEADIVEQTRGTFLGDRRVRAHIAACAQWPRAAVPLSFLDPVKSSIPTVFYSGEADGATPPWIAEREVGLLSNGRQIRVPHSGHQLAGACAWNLMRDFIARPFPLAIDASCVTGVTRPPFVLDIPR